MLLDDVAAYLETNTAFTIGSSSGTLAKAAMLDGPAPDTLIALYETGGVAPSHMFSTSTSQTTVVFEQPNLQVLSRSTAYQTARTNAETIYTTLDGVHDVTLPTATGTRYLSITALQSPFSVGPDRNGRHIVSVNFTVMKELG